MSKSIRLHKEHGLNPTLSICIICKEETGEIALLGAGYKGEAPKHLVTSVIPCDKCKEKYLKTGVMLAEVEIKYNTIKRELQPTGNLAVITDEAFKRLFAQEEIPKEKISYVAVGVLQNLQGDYAKLEK